MSNINFKRSQFWEDMLKSVPTINGRTSKQTNQMLDAFVMEPNWKDVWSKKGVAKLYNSIVDMTEKKRESLAHFEFLWEVEDLALQVLRDPRAGHRIIKLTRAVFARIKCIREDMEDWKEENMENVHAEKNYGFSFNGKRGKKRKAMEPIFNVSKKDKCAKEYESEKKIFVFNKRGETRKALELIFNENKIEPGHPVPKPRTKFLERQKESIENEVKGKNSQRPVPIPAPRGASSRIPIPIPMPRSQNTKSNKMANETDHKAQPGNEDDDEKISKDEIVLDMGKNGLSKNQHEEKIMEQNEKTMEQNEKN